MPLNVVAMLVSSRPAILFVYVWFGESFIRVLEKAFDKMLI